MQMKVSGVNTGCCATARWQKRSAPQMATPVFVVRCVCCWSGDDMQLQRC